MSTWDFKFKVVLEYFGERDLRLYSYLLYGQFVFLLVYEVLVLVQFLYLDDLLYKLFTNNSLTYVIYLTIIPLCSHYVPSGHTFHIPFITFLNKLSPKIYSDGVTNPLSTTTTLGRNLRVVPLIFKSKQRPF